MPSALLVRFRPAGPWRLGPDNGAADRTDRILHSDAVYSALTIAMRDLGWLEDWLAATAQASEPALRLTSCYPWTGRLLMVEPPRSLWPVAQTGKLRWKSAKFIPASVIPALIRGESMKEDQWAIDPVSECLLPVTRNGPMHPPFRVAKRRFASVDRGTGVSEAAREVACLQFAPSSGMWFAAVFASDRARDQWTGKFRSACRLLADQGIGGGKSAGWGVSDEPRFETVGDWNRMLTGAEGEIAGDSAWWLLSLFTPGPADAVEWKRGNYATCVRSGRVNGSAEVKPPSRMVTEGSVLLSPSPLTGVVRNVAAEDAPHPVYRSGLAVAVPIPWKESRRLPWMVEPEAAPVEAPAAAEDDVIEVEAFAVSDEAGAEPVVDPGLPADAELSASLEGEELPVPEVPPSGESEAAVAEAATPVTETETAPVPEPPKPSSEDDTEPSAWLEGEPVTPVAEDTPEVPVEEPTPDEPPAQEPPSEEPPAGEPPTEEPPVTDPDPNREGTLS